MAQTLEKYNEDGSLVDYLEEDPEVPTQRYCIMSFISPEKVLKQKAEFYNEKFIQWLEYDWKISGLEKFMDFLSKKYSLKVDDLMKDATEFAGLHNADIRKTDVNDKYQTFLMKCERDLETEFTEKVEFRTNVRGVKLRRVFGSLEEAQMYAKVLQRKYPRDNLYVGKVGCWLPWDPSEHAPIETEYAEKELNEMMRKYKENEMNKDIFFEERKRDELEKQRKANQKNKEDIAKALTDAPPAHPTEGAIRE